MENCEHETNVRHGFDGRMLCDECYTTASAPMRAARARTIDQVAQLFPFLSIAERTDWWKRLGCSITELTTYMQTDQQKYADAVADRHSVTSPALTEGDQL